MTDLSEWRLRIYMYAMQMVCQHITHILRQCVNCVPTNSTYTKPYSSHIHLTFQGPRLQLPVQPSGPGLNDKTSATNVHFWHIYLTMWHSSLHSVMTKLPLDLKRLIWSTNGGLRPDISFIQINHTATVHLCISTIKPPC